MTAPHGRRSFTSHWAVLLAGPIVGITYFFVIYLLAEASCADELELVSSATLRIVIVAAAVLSTAVLAAYARRALQLRRAAAGDHADSDLAQERRDNGRFMVTTGLLLLGMFVLFVLFLAAPSLGGSLC